MQLSALFSSHPTTQFCFSCFHVMLNNRSTWNIWQFMEKNIPCFALKHHIFMESQELEIVKAFWVTGATHVLTLDWLFSFPAKAACDMVVQRNLHFNRMHFHKSSTWFCLCLWPRYIQCYTGHMKLQQGVVNDVGNEKFITKSKEVAKLCFWY